jgi:nitrous oxidase accessory protein NosD
MDKSYKLFYNGLVLVIVFLFLASIIPQTKADNIQPRNIRTTIYVDDDASCPGSGTIQSPYCMIQYAIDNANENDIIMVANGTYYENIIIRTKGIQLRWYGSDIIGQDPGKPIIDGNKLSDVVKIFGDNIEISQFTIQNSGDLNYGVNILAEKVEIYECNIIDNYNGIQLLRPECILCIIEECTIRRNVLSGVLLLDLCSQNTIKSCQITHNKWGVWVMDSFDHFIQENFFTGNEIGVVLQGANTYNVDVRRCVFKKNEVGLWVFGNSNRNFIHYCDFIDNINRCSPLSFISGFWDKGPWRMHAVFTLCNRQSWSHNYWSPRPFLENTTQPYPIWGTMFPTWISTFLPGAWRPQFPWVNVDMNCRAKPL